MGLKMLDGQQIDRAGKNETKKKKKNKYGSR